MNQELKGKIEEWHKAVTFWDRNLDRLDDEVKHIPYSESYCYVRRAVNESRRDLAQVQEACNKLKKRNFSDLERMDYLRKFITISSRFLASPEFSDDFCAGYRELYGTLPADPAEEARRRREEEARRHAEEEAARRREEEARRREEERLRREEAERQREEAARRRRAEDERRRAEEEARRRAEEERIRLFKGPYIAVSRIDLGNSEQGGRLLSDFGQPLYTDTQYLVPRITFSNRIGIRVQVQLGVKIYAPGGRLLQGASSPSGYTYMCQVYTDAGEAVLDGWGNSHGDGYKEAGRWTVEVWENGQLLRKTSVMIHERYPRRSESVAPSPDPRLFVPRRRKRSPLKLVLIAVAVLVGVSLVGNVFSVLLSAFTSDGAGEADAGRSAYVVADRLLLRSSPLATVESNVLSALAYGSELTVQADSAGWARVSTGGQTGYVSSAYLLPPADFMRLENAWGNADARASVPQSRARLAVLDYLKRENLPSGKDGWQLFAKSGGGRGVLFPRLDNGLDDFEDFAFLLVNNRTDERRMALYGFKPSEEPVLLFAEQAPARGGLSHVAQASADGSYRVTYGGGGSPSAPSRTSSAVKESAPVSTKPANVASPAPSRQVEPASASRERTAGVPVLSVWRSQFADMGADGRLRGQFGDDLTAGMHFLASRIYCTANRNAGQPVRLDVKLFAPDGRLVTGPDSPAGYTFNQTVQVPASSTGQFFYTLQGWGRAGGGYFRPGKYRYEVWIDGERAHWATVHVGAVKS